VFRVFIDKTSESTNRGLESTRLHTGLDRNHLKFGVTTRVTAVRPNFLNTTRLTDIRTCYIHAIANLQETPFLSNHALNKGMIEVLNALTVLAN
jgi:hypothetical protein